MTPIDMMLDGLEWRAVPAPDEPSNLPHVTHTGVVTIAGKELVCHRLSNGERVFTKESFEKFFGDEP